MSFNFVDFLVRFIVPAVWVFLAAIAVATVFDGGRVFIRRRTINRRAGTRFFRKYRLAIRREALEPADITRAVVLGVVTGALNYFAFVFVPAAPWLMFAAIAMIIYTMIWWQDNCASVGQLVPFAVMMVPMFAAVFNTAEQSVLNTWINVFFVSVLHCTFWIVLTLAVSFYIVSLLYRYYSCTGSYSEASMYRGLAWTVKVIALIIVALIVWLGFAWNTVDWSFGKPAAAQNTEQQATTSVDIDEEVKVAVNDLTVTEVTEAELEELTVKKYAKISQVLLQSSLTTHDRKRTKSAGFSDALTYGFKNKKSTSKMFKELEEEILRNPVYGVTVANALKNKKVGNKTIGSFNPWMGKMVSINREKGLSYWLEHRGNSKTIYVTNEYRRYAATLCTFLERLVDQGVQTRKTSENWCLNATSKNNKRAGIKASYQYSRKALIMAYVGKNKVSFLIVGFNIHDKRPEFYSKKHQPKIVKTPKGPTGGGSTPSNPTPDNPTPNPTNPKPTPTNPTPTTPKYNKDPSKAPKKNTEKNDDPGPGKNTNNGKGAQKSKDDSQYNSGNSPSSKKDQEDQKARNNNPSNTPSTNGGGAAVDNPGANDNLYTPTQGSAQTNGHSVTDDEDGGDWGSPPD